MSFPGSKSRIAVVTDSTSDLPAALLEEFEISTVPLNIWIDGEQYLDRVTIEPSQFISLLATAKGFPTTSQPSVGAFQQVYESLAETHDEIISIHLSSRLSGTYQSAVLAAESIASHAHVSVIDTGTVSMALGFAVLEAAGMARDGYPVPEIVEAVRRVAGECEVLFLVDTLEYLRRGGRIGRAAELLGSMLRVKPILKVDDGVVSPLARTRTRPRALATVASLVRELAPLQRVAVLTSSTRDDLEPFIENLSQYSLNGQVIVSELSPVLSAHTGPGCIGVVAQKQTAQRGEAVTVA